MARRALLVVLALLLAGCQREPRFWVELSRIESGTELELGDTEVRALAFERLRANKRLQLTDPARPPPSGTPVWSLEVGVDEPWEKDGTVVVGCQLQLSTSGLDAVIAHGRGQRRLDSDGGDSALRAAQTALTEALDRAADLAVALLAARERPDASLVKDLQRGGVAREAAVQWLVRRHNPAALEPLVDRLEQGDEIEVRRTIGLLVELHDPRAVPPLIELGRTKDLLFLREIIFALGEIGGDEAEAYVYTLGQGHDHPAIRAAAQQALDELGARKKRKEHQP